LHVRLIRVLLKISQSVSQMLFECSSKLSERNIRLLQLGWQTVPYARSSSSEWAIAKTCVGVRSAVFASHLAYISHNSFLLCVFRNWKRSSRQTLTNGVNSQQCELWRRVEVDAVW